MNKIKNTNLELFYYVSDFLKEYLPKHRGSSVKTSNTYAKALDQFFTFIALKKHISLGKVCFNDIKRETIIDFLDDGTDRLNWKASTRNLKLYAIRSFLSYVSQIDSGYLTYSLVAQNITEQKEIEDAELIKYFEIETLQTLLAMPDRKSEFGFRDVVIMSFLFDTGCRVSELLNVHLMDLRDMKTNGGLVTLHGKGNKVRNTPLTVNMMYSLKNYIKKYHKNNEPEDYLFYSSHSGPKKQMSADNIQRIINKYVDKANRADPNFGYEHINVHAFRHSRAMYMLRNGIPLALIGNYLGHVNPATTRIYASADTSMKRIAMEKALYENHPLKQELLREQRN